MAEATIAGIAKALNFVIVTRNTKQFAPFGVDVATLDEVLKLER